MTHTITLHLQEVLYAHSILLRHWVGVYREARGAMNGVCQGSSLPPILLYVPAGYIQSVFTDRLKG